MSTYHIDLEGSKADGVVFVKLSGRAQTETIVKLLDELNALAEVDSSLYGPNGMFSGSRGGSGAGERLQ